MIFLKEQDLDFQTVAITKKTITGIRSKAEINGKISKSFEIKTGVRQEDGICSFLFNCVLEKLIHEWGKDKGTQNEPNNL